MENKEWQDFLPINKEAVKVLCIDELFDISAIREKLPMAEIYSITGSRFSDEKTLIKLDWADKDTYDLPIKTHFFDYILAGEFVNAVENLTAFFQKMYGYLKKNGKILAKTFNARHWRRIEEIVQGKTIYPELKRQPAVFWHDFVQVMEKCGYLEIQASSIYDPMPENFFLNLNEDVFNFTSEEPNIYYWWVNICCMDKTEEELISSFTPKLRQEMVFLLRRVEHDIDVEVNSQNLWHIFDEWDVLPAYIVLLAQNSLSDGKKALLKLAVYAESEKNRWKAILLLQNWYEQDGSNNAVLSYVLAGLFYMQKDYVMAEKILLSVLCRTQDIEELLVQIRREKND